MKTAVIYARYSSDNQSEQSIEGQLRVCNDYANTHDMVILDTYIDRAMTGTNDNRPAFQKMIKDSHRKEWDVILLYKLDKFSRNKYEMAIHKKTLKDNGVRVISATEYIPDSPEAIILESMLEGYAEYYSAELSQKVKRGMKETRIKGNFMGGYLLYGYKIVNKKIVINEEQAEVVKYIFDEYAHDVFVKDIIANLTAKGIYNRGKPFARNTIYNILRNEKYSGIYRYNDEIFDNYYPRIVPAETFDKVRLKVDKNRYGKHDKRFKYLLKFKLKCGYCGESITAECGTNRKGDVQRYYKCYGRKHNNGCEKQNVRKDILESLVTQHVIETLNSETAINTLVNGLLKVQDKQIKTNDTLARLIKELKQTENAINNIMSAVEQGGSTNTAMKRIRELEDKQNTLNKNIAIEKSRTVEKMAEKEIRGYYTKALTYDIENIVNILVKEVILYDDKMEIIFNTPLQTSPDESQGFSFSLKTAKLTSYIKSQAKYVSINFGVIMRV